MPKYDPVVIDVRQSRYGYWIVIISVAPGLRMPVMVAKLGITPQQAALAALAPVAATPLPARYA